MNKTPDALPAMAVTAAFAEGTTRLTNAPQARGKETDRIRCMAEELKKLSVDVEELSDGLIIRCGLRETSDERRRTNRPSSVTHRPSFALDGRSDHRIVMALSLAGLAVEGGCSIDTAEAIGVTFPDYVKLMKSIGANMETT
jgi:3-phosphoshikimate 1-carboxyvinyltransferase